MKITRFKDYASMSAAASAIIISDLNQKKNLRLGAATGGSPTGMYAALAEAYQKDASLFDHLQVTKLDEWGIIPMSHPDSCQSYLKQHLLGPLHVSADRYEEFDTNNADLLAECKRIQDSIDQNGPLDIVILGLGKNGHIGFNEPAAELQVDCHKAILAESTIQHDPTLLQGDEPAFGLTLGLKSILQAKKILFLVTGSGKEEAIKQLMTKKISTFLPASFLWLHPHVECLINENA
ncbi:MAG: 6-phosphogluconolactonase [Aquirufa sp.]